MILDAVKLSTGVSVVHGGHSRPVELAELHETELDIARAVLKEGLARSGGTLGDVLKRGKLQFGKLDTHIDKCFEEFKNPYVRKGGRLGGATFKNSKTAASPHPHATLGSFYHSIQLVDHSPPRVYLYSRASSTIYERYVVLYLN